MRPLTNRQFDQIYDEMAARAGQIGRTVVAITPASRQARKVRITVSIPGLDADFRLPDEAEFIYEDWFRLTALGWVRVRYNYNYRDLRSGGRWGLHLHPLAGRRSAEPHMVCVRPDGRGEGKHYAAHEIDLRAAHEWFVQHLAQGVAIACSGLTPID